MEKLTENLKQLYHSEKVLGMFLVFDAVLQGFSISGNYEYTQDEETNELGTYLASKVVTLSAGMFHLIKFKDREEVWFVTGFLDQYPNSGYTQHTIATLTIDEYYDPDRLSFADDEDDVFVESILVTEWHQHIAPCLNDPKKLNKVLQKISITLQQHEDFLLEYADSCDFNGLAAEQQIEGEMLTDQNFEILFKAFIERINKDVLPKLEF